MSLNFRTLRDYIASLSTVTPTGLDRVPLHDLSNTADMSAATFDGIVDGVAADATLARTTGATFTGNVVVPDANADGEAIAYDQSGARLAGLTSTTDVTISNAVAANLVLYDTGGSVDNKKIRFQMASDTLAIQSLVDAGTFKANLAGYTEATGWTFYVPVTVPDANADGEAIAYDQANWQLGTGVIKDRLTIQSPGTPGRTFPPGVKLLDTDSSAYGEVAVNGNEFTLRPKLVSTDAQVAKSILIDLTTGGVNMQGAPNVTVPDANADGEAIAYDQANWQLGNGTVANANASILTVAGNTDAVGTTGGAYVLLSVSNINRFALAVNTVTPDELSLNRYDQTTGAYVGTQKIFDAAGNMYVPAISGTGQAAQVTAYDATTGRLAIGGREVGDTGWRDVSGSLINGWTGTAYIRRCGYNATLMLEINGSAKTASEALTLPDGFYTSGSKANTIRNLVHDTSLNLGRSYLSDSALAVSTSSTNTMYGNFVFPCAAGWPTSLPGSAA